MTKELPYQISRSLKRLRRQSAILQYLYVVLGGISILSPLIVTSFTDLLGDLMTRIVSFCGACAILLIVGFRISWHANKMRHSYVELRLAITKFETTDEYSLRDLTTEYIKISNKIGSILGPQVEQLKTDVED